MPKVKVYTTENCPRCVRVKDALRRMGVEFEELDINDVDVQVDLTMRNIVLMSAPAVEIAGMVFEYRGGA